MTAELISTPASRRTTGWSGRASQHRRLQVRAQSSDPAARMRELWSEVVEVLSSIDGPTVAVLCAADGTPVVSHGLARVDQRAAAHAARTVFADRSAGDVDEASPCVETVEVVDGDRSTVVAAISSTGRADHLLAVTAEGVSPHLLETWTRHAAEDLRAILADD